MTPPTHYYRDPEAGRIEHGAYTVIGPCASGYSGWRCSRCGGGGYGQFRWWARLRFWLHRSAAGGTPESALIVDEWHPVESGEVCEMLDEIVRLREALTVARHCISKHQGGCINGCYERTAAAGDTPTEGGRT